MVSRPFDFLFTKTLVSILLLIALEDVSVMSRSLFCCQSSVGFESIGCFSTLQRIICQFELSQQDLPPPSPSRESRLIAETILSAPVVEFTSPLLLTRRRFKLMTVSREQLIAEGATRASQEETSLLLENFIRMGFALHSLESIDFSELGSTDLIGLFRQSTNHGILLPLKNWETARTVLSLPQFAQKKTVPYASLHSDASSQEQGRACSRSYCTK
jgi:hypothetical protein